jgi:hypothetical protein
VMAQQRLGHRRATRVAGAHHEDSQAGERTERCAQ